MNNWQVTINGHPAPYTSKVWGGGEIHVAFTEKTFDVIAEGDRYLDTTLYASITGNCKSSADLMELFLLTDAIRRLQIKDVKLVCKYLPYARQDRVCAAGESLSLKVFCDLINAQKYTEVQIWDCHSDVGTALLDNCLNITQDMLVFNTLRVGYQRLSPVLVAPDAGAMKKVQAVAKKLQTDFVRADKTRAADGSITGTVVYSEHIGKRNFLICDDIVDGGRTFIELAKALRPLTDGEIWLYCTHGIFSYGLDVFDGLIDKVFIANPLKDISSKSNFYP